MNALQILKKFLVLTISWSLIFSTTAFATTGDSDSPQPDSNAGVNNPDYCAVDQQTNNCGEGQKYVCHLQKCAPSGEANRYNKEYSDCQYDDDPESCRGNLKSLHDDIESTQQLAFDNDGKGEEAGEDVSLAADLVAVGTLGSVIVAGVTETFITSWSGIFAAAIAAMALMMKHMSEDAAESQLDEIKAKIDQLEDEGFVVERQIEVFQLEVAALEAMLSSAEMKADNHGTLVTMWGIALLMGTIELAMCLGSFGTACTGGPWIPGQVMIVSGIAVGLEQQAQKDTEDIMKKIREAIETTKGMITKLDGIYSRDAKDYTMVTPGGSISSGNNSKGGAQIAAANQYLGTRDGKDGEIGFCRVSGKIQKCPCPDNKCDSVGDNFIPLSGPLGQQIQKTGIFDNLDKAIDEFYAGNPDAISQYASGERGALANKLRKKLVKKLLANKKLKMDKGTKDILTSFDTGKFKRGFSKPFMMGPVGLAALQNSSPSLEKAEKMAKRYSRPYRPIKKGQAVDHLAALKARLAALKGAMEEQGEPVASEFTNDNSMKLALNDKTIAEKEKGKAKIHPDTKISIFKIISNRYNIMRIKKAFGF